VKRGLSELSDLLPDNTWYSQLFNVETIKKRLLCIYV